jgi:hypothetical protein
MKFKYQGINTKLKEDSLPLESLVQYTSVWGCPELSGSGFDAN